MREIVKQGPLGTIEYAVQKDGIRPAKVWLTQEATPRAVAYFSHLFLRLLEHGRIHDEAKFRHLGDNMWEFKMHAEGGHRLLAVMVSRRRYLLTHHCPKMAPKKFQKEIAIANRIIQEHLEIESNYARPT